MAELHRYADLLSAGLTREQVRQRLDAGAFDRLSRGVYGVGADARHHLAALIRRLPADTVLGHSTGAWLHGFGDPHDIVHVIVPAGVVVPRIKGVVVHQAVLPVRAPVRIAGLPCAPAARCAVDLTRALRRMDALPVLDLCLRAGACRPEELLAEVALHGGLRGVCQARQLVRLADPRSECRQESQLRLLLIDGGLPAPEPQVWVRDRNGIPLYRLDLGYRERLIGIEYDGRTHLARDRLRSDRARMNWLAANGWRMRYFTDLDLYRRPDHILTTLKPLFLRS
ncbi:endonuclease domain-containing protein [Micromonospora sp. NPDC049366]|uniref:endonuclease domain-containing protein n=1 Tax=Micromonospora sp. NPDC049366 TaxID=3364271 RepID=UPI00378F25A5